MITYDFKTYHTRSINAATPTERAAINQELKDLYAALSPDEQANFNQQLQTFLTQTVGRIKSDFESVRGEIRE